MATYVKFNVFLEELVKGAHQFHAAGHTFKVYLSNTAPDVANHANQTDLPGITEANNYAAADIQNDVSRSSNVTSVTAQDVVWTATGNVGPFRYAVVMNTNAANKLVCYHDYGSSINLVANETFTWNVGANNVLFNIS